MDKNLMARSFTISRSSSLSALLSSFNELRQSQLVTNSGFKITRFFSLYA